MRGWISVICAQSQRRYLMMNKKSAVTVLDVVGGVLIAVVLYIVSVLLLSL